MSALRVLKTAVKDVGFRALAGAGIPRLAHHLLLRNQVTILMYHAVIDMPLPFPDWCFVAASDFRLHMQYLSRHFEVLSLSNAIALLRSAAIRRPTAVITFDDGFQNNYHTAFPILREFGIPATIFVATGLVDTSDTTWPCRLHWALQETRRPAIDWEGAHLDLSTPVARAHALSRFTSLLRELPHPDLLQEVARLGEVLEVDMTTPLEPDSPFRMLSTLAMRDMAASGLLEFGAHTQSHAILSRLSTADCRREIECSVTRIGELAGRRCRFFAYPNGRVQDYDARSMAILKTCGVEAAVTTIVGGNTRKTPLFELRRLGIGSSLNATQFVMRTHHWRGKFGG